MSSPAETLSPQPHAAGTTSRGTWWEIGAVVLLVSAPTLSSLGRSLFWGDENPRPVQHRRHVERQTPAAYDTALFDSIFLRLRLVPVILIVMWRSGEGWSRFGLVRPQIAKDILTGLALWLAVALFDALIAWASGRPHPWLGMSPIALPWRRAALLLADCCAIGFSEELTARAYLIPRLETATKATWISVVLSVSLFTLLHVYKGYVGLIHSFAAAMVWSLGFCVTRRIWPLAISHAMVDFIVESHAAAAIGI